MAMVIKSKYEVRTKDCGIVKAVMATGFNEALDMFMDYASCLDSGLSDLGYDDLLNEEFTVECLQTGQAMTLTPLVGV